ncbi:PEP-CTERM sorting domain-containing protein [Salinisphaera aquimarina]|uniref:PEP-CTERM sorting domain-containing protein n=1 Tax=Salinisphaera aquimarina TaxID=2094031 RepID=A0ABV7EQ66_9GAMM
MKIMQTFLGAVATIGLIGVGMSSAYAATINFDQEQSRASGDLSYSGGNTALTGNDITFSYVSGDGVSRLNCQGCLLNFTTGGFSDRIDTGGGNAIYLFNSGGTFELKGTVVDGSGTTLVDNGTILSGQFVGTQSFTRQGDSSGTFNGNGSNSVDDSLASYFGIAPGSEYMFISTDFSSEMLTFENGGFNGDLTAADLQTTSQQAVPEPGEMGVFGLGLALMMVGLAYRRKNGSNLG